MNVTHKLTIDLLTRGVADPVHAVQCDANTRAVAVTLTAGGVAWEPPANTAISVAFKKPDGKKGWYDKLPDGSSACSVSGNVVTAILAPEVLTAAGKVDAVIVFQDKDINQLATFGFAILVEPNPAAGRGISNDYYAYSTMEDVSKAVDAMLDSLEETKADIGQLIVQVSEAVSRAEQAAGPAIVNQASGDVIAVADSSDRQLQGLKVFGKTVQNGTPSPNAPVELESAGANGSIGIRVVGKNLLKNTYASATLNGVTFTVNEDGSIRTSGTASADAYIKVGEAVLNAGVKYTLSGCPSGGGTGTYMFYVASKNVFDFGNGSSFTADGSSYAVWLKISSGYNASNLLFKPMIRLASFTDPEFEPYKPTQTLTASTPNGLHGIPVTSGGNYTDENGQAWICDEVDFARGVYVQRTGAYTFAGNESWKLNNDGWLQAQIIAVKDMKIGSQVGICEFAEYNYAYDGDGMFVFRTVGMSFIIAVIGAAQVNSAGLTVNNVNQKIAGQKVLYELETPVEAPIPAEELAAYAALHSNKPNTTVHNDGGAHMELSYVADTKLYIDNKIAAIAAAVLNNT